MQLSFPKTPHSAPKSAQVLLRLRHTKKSSSQTLPLAHGVQLRKPPQPSGGKPQPAPACRQVLGTQTQPPATGSHLYCSGQRALLGVRLHPPGSEHVSSVQAMPSSAHSKLGALRQPVVGFAPAPGAQISVPSQTAPFAQVASLGAFVQLSSASLQVSVVQLAPSLHGATPGWQPVAGAQVSVPLQNLPSSQGGGVPGTQKLLGPHVSTPLQASPSEQSAEVAAVQGAPFWQPAPTMQNFPAPHFVESGVSTHAPVASLHVETTHAVAGGGHTVGVPSLQPATGSHVSVPLQGLASSQLSGVPFTQPVPTWHFSMPVQTSLSLQRASSPVAMQPLTGSQLSVVHAMPSSHTSALPAKPQPAFTVHFGVP